MLLIIVIKFFGFCLLHTVKYLLFINSIAVLLGTVPESKECELPNTLGQPIYITLETSLYEVTSTFKILNLNHLSEPHYGGII
jgi:hypothetical protein